MPRDLAGSVALVTGASRGIGRAVAEGLAQDGCHVALVARSAEGLAETAKRCRSHGVQTASFPCDVTDRNRLAMVVEGCLEQLGGLGILVNNAGIMARGAAHEADMDAFEQVIDVNVKALMNLSRLALPHIIEAPGARAVIHIASVAGRMSFGGGGAYCASKHAVMGYAGAMFEDVREYGVKVTAICPGFVDTDMVRDRGLNSAKMIQPEDIALAVRFVAGYPDTGCPTEIVVRPQRVPYGA